MGSDDANWLFSDSPSLEDTTAGMVFHGDFNLEKFVREVGVEKVQETINKLKV